MKILAPAARNFKPDLILISAGYDAHWMDPLADERLSVTGYGVLVNELLALADELCGGKIIFALEGGYNLEVLPHCILTTLRTISGDERGPSDPFGKPTTTERDVNSLIERIRLLHQLQFIANCPLTRQSAKVFALSTKSSAIYRIFL